MCWLEPIEIIGYSWLPARVNPAYRLREWPPENGTFTIARLEWGTDRGCSRPCGILGDVKMSDLRSRLLFPASAIVTYVIAVWDAFGDLRILLALAAASLVTITAWILSRRAVAVG